VRRRRGAPEADDQQRADRRLDGIRRQWEPINQARDCVAVRRGVDDEFGEDGPLREVGEAVRIGQPGERPSVTVGVHVRHEVARFE
jgi:hypothetical protein